MSENKTFLDRQPVFLQLLILIGLVGLFSAFFTIIGMVLIRPLYGITGVDTFFSKFQTDPDSFKNDFNAINALKFIQLLSSFGLLLPALFFGILKKPQGDYLRLRSSFKPVMVIWVILIFLSSGPLIDLLYGWNQQMKLPSFLKGVENFMRSAEDTDAKLTTIFLIMPKLPDFIYNLILIGILPAIAEEFLFRGALQKLLREWFGNAHVAIWVAAIIFSAIHIQFYGFIPRMVLGALLGYMFYWSGNIWVPIIGHFINNSGLVILVYLHQQKIINYDVNSNEAAPGYVIIVGTVLLAGFLYMAYKSRTPEPVQTDGSGENDSNNPTLNGNPWP